MTDGLDTGGPQGPPPTASDSGSGSEGGGAGLNLDRLAQLAQASWKSWSIQPGDLEYWYNQADLASLEDAVDAAFIIAADPRTVRALVERVRTLEAVAEAAREYVSDIDEEGVASDDAIRAALAAAGGGAHE